MGLRWGEGRCERTVSQGERGRKLVRRYYESAKSYERLGGEGKRIVGPFDCGAELGFGALDDDGVEVEFGGQDGEGGRIGRVEFQAEELAAGRCVGGGMNCASGHFSVGVSKYKARTPFNEEREKAIGVVFKSEGLPVEFLAVGAFARAG